MEFIMDEKMKRKGTPRRLYTKLMAGIWLVVLLGAGILTLLIVKNMNTSDETQLTIAPISAELSIPPEIAPLIDLTNNLNSAIMVNGENYYLCLTIPEGVLLSIDLAALRIRINNAAISYRANTGAPLNCLLLDATLARGWYIVELQTLDSASHQPTANYIWGIQVR
jgi:hypothetical protein